MVQIVNIVSDSFRNFHLKLITEVSNNDNNIHNLMIIVNILKCIDNSFIIFKPVIPKRFKNYAQEISKEKNLCILV